MPDPAPTAARLRELRGFLHARPWKPFRVILTDGRSFTGTDQYDIYGVDLEGPEAAVLIHEELIPLSDIAAIEPAGGKEQD
jgi:hypothetical protein